MIVLEPVQAAVWNCLQNFMYSDAVFLAERLHAELTTEESAHTLATCYYKAGDTLQAYDVLSKCPVSKPASKYLLARCCWKINRLQEAEAALVGSQGLKGFDELVAEFGDMSCFVLAMLGELYVKSERRNLGVQALRKALSLNPFLFSTFQLLCNLGESPNPKEFFRFDSTDSTHNLGTSCWQNFAHSKLTLNQSIAVHPHHQVTHVFPEDHSTPAHPVSTPMQEVNKCWLPAAPCKVKGTVVSSSPVVNLRKRQLEMLTPVNQRKPAFGALLLPTESPAVLNASYVEISCPTTQTPKLSPNIKDLQPHPLRSSPLVVSQTNNFAEPDDVPRVAEQPPLKRSARLQPAAVTKENKLALKSRVPRSTACGSALPKRLKTRGVNPRHRSDSENENKGGSSAEQSNNREPIPVAVENVRNLEKTAAIIEEEKDVVELANRAQRQSAAGLMSLFQDLGAAYLKLSKFECAEALTHLRSLSHDQSRTGWVLCLRARILYELSLYEDCVKTFALVRELEPLRLDGLEMYSSALWQLQRDVELSALAGELLALCQDHMVPWVTQANCFSANQEHAAAIRYLQRAVQLDPSSSYVYTLLGQEFLMVDDLDNAQAAFRNAMFVNREDYRAWMGLGLVTLKQEQYKNAKVSFKKALKLNPHSTLMLCYLGMCSAKLKEYTEAEETFKLALAINPRNPLCKYHLATTLVSKGSLDEAANLLVQLTEETPREAQVFFLLGKIFKKLGKENMSLMYISWAVDLDPKVGKAPWKDRATGSVTASAAGVTGSAVNNVVAGNGGAGAAISPPGSSPPSGGGVNGGGGSSVGGGGGMGGVGGSISLFNADEHENSAAGASGFEDLPSHDVAESPLSPV